MVHSQVADGGNLWDKKAKIVHEMQRIPGENLMKNLQMKVNMPQMLVATWTCLTMNFIGP
jgi:hypothetical protein